jgi:Cu+-exporting ATPase
VTADTGPKSRRAVEPLFLPAQEEVYRRLTLAIRDSHHDVMWARVGHATKSSRREERREQNRREKKHKQNKYKSSSSVHKQALFVSSNSYTNDTAHKRINSFFHLSKMTAITTTIHLQVTGMMCQRNCGTTVANALKDVPGAIGEDTGSSFAERRAWMTIALLDTDTDTSNNTTSLTLKQAQEEAVDAIECVGFEAAIIHDLNLYLEQTLSSSSDSDTANQNAQSQEAALHEETMALSSFNNNGTDSNYKFGVTLQVGGMSCAVCTGRVEKALLQNVPGVVRVAIALATHRATVTLNEPPTQDIANQCQEAIEQAGYDCEVLQWIDSSSSSTSTATTGISLADNARKMDHLRKHELANWRRLFLTSLIFTVPMMVLHYGNISLGNNHADTEQIPSTTTWAMFFLATPVQFLVGGRYYKAAWKAAMGGAFGMDFLVVMGTTASYVYSLILLYTQYNMSSSSGSSSDSDNMDPDPTFATAALLFTFVTLGKFLESYAKGKTANALQSLMELQPTLAWKIIDTQAVERSPETAACLETQEVELKDLKVGDYLRVFPGSRIPTDGLLVACSSSSSQSLKSNGTVAAAYIDESTFSGEPHPVCKQPGDKVYGSTVNQLSVLVVQVQAVGRDTVLAKIVHLMEQAQSQKAPIQAVADNIAGIFAPVVFGLSLLTFCVWMLCNSNCAMDERIHSAVMFAISVVVVACPCALGLATPTAIMVGTGVGASQGLLIKGGAVLEGMHSVSIVILDKTGTITTGKAVLRDVTSFISPDDDMLQQLPSQVSSSLEQNVVIWLAACAEAQSEHPLAHAVVNAARAKWGGDVICASQGVTVANFRMVPGMGVECLVSKPQWGSYWVRVGNQQWTNEGSTKTNVELVGAEEVMRLRQQGQIGVHVSVKPSAGESQSDWSVIGVFGVVDPMKPEAPSAISALQKMGVDVWMCTGDHKITAHAVARQLGIPTENVVAGVKPEDKADLVTRLQQEDDSSSAIPAKRNHVAFVGDGINDAIALARADVGVAIGAGTEVAVEAADIVLVKSSLHDVVVAIHLSKTVFQRIRLNFVWAMGYNLLALPFAAGILYPFTNFQLPPEFAGLMMAFSSVSVVTSSLLLRRYKRPIIAEDGSMEKTTNVPGVWPQRLVDTCCRCVCRTRSLLSSRSVYLGLAVDEDSKEFTSNLTALEMV